MAGQQQHTARRWHGTGARKGQFRIKCKQFDTCGFQTDPRRTKAEQEAEFRDHRRAMGEQVAERREYTRLSIDLPPDTVDALERLAAAENTTARKLAARLLAAVAEGEAPT